MVKVGTLQDLKESIQKLKNAGCEPVQLRGDLVRKVMVGNEKVISCAKIRGNLWSFIYNEKYFKES